MSSDPETQARTIQRAILARNGRGKRLRQAFLGSDLARELALSRLRRDHPDWSEFEILRALLRRQGCHDFPPEKHKWVQILDDSGIPYMLTGSFASSFHGEVRASQDLDLVIAPEKPQLRSFINRLPPSTLYVSEQAALEALERRGQFNIIDQTSGWKIDLIIQKDRPFSRVEFDRRQAVDALGIRLYIGSAEDVVITKLEWAKRGLSDRQLEDVAGILRDPDTSLDRTYIDRWVKELDLGPQWERAQEFLVR